VELVRDDRPKESAEKKIGRKGGGGEVDRLLYKTKNRGWGEGGRNDTTSMKEGGYEEKGGPGKANI